MNADLSPKPSARVTRSGRGSVFASFKAAQAGVCRTLATQRNMKLHVLSALMVMIVGMTLPLALSTRVSLLFAVAIVFFAEILNTGLEALTDLFIGDYHRLAMLAKDAAAGGVLVLALVTLLIFLDVIYTEWHLVLESLDAVKRSVIFGVPLVLCEALGLFVIRRGVTGVLRVLVSIGLLIPLVMASRDPVFSLVAFILVFLSAYTRHAFPTKTPRGAPSSQ